MAVEGGVDEESWDAGWGLGVVGWGCQLSVVS